MVRHAMTLIRVLVSAELLTRSRMTHANQASVLQSQRGTMVNAHNRVGVAQIVSNAHRVFVIVQMWSCSSPTLTSELHAPHVQQHAFDMPPRVCRQCLLSDIVVVALHHPSMNCPRPKVTSVFWSVIWTQNLGRFMRQSNCLFLTTRSSFH